jgi:hypothetical protein
MRAPRLRFSVRPIMVALMGVSLLTYGRRVQHHRLNMAGLCGIADPGVLHMGMTRIRMG